MENNKMTQKVRNVLILCFTAVTINSCTYDHQVLQAQKKLKDSGYLVSRQNNLNKRGIALSKNVQNRTAFHVSGQQVYDQMCAVIIGIDRYQNLGRDSQLNYAVHDARGVASLLKDKYSFKTITLYNENATRARIMKILQGDLTETGANDAVLIYFAGHGITRKTPQGILGYLLPSDGSVKRNEMHKNISMQQIKSDICPLIQAKHVLIIADACFGGLLLSTRSTNSIPSYDFSYIKEITSERVRQIITAGGKDERVLDEGRGGHSVFTGRLIEKLEQIDCYITARQLGEDLKQKVYSDAIDRGHTQLPHVGKIYGVCDFVFIPDIAKKQQAMNKEVNRLLSEIEKLEALKISSKELKSKAELREIEREQLLKQAILKQTQLKQQAAERETRLREMALAEEQRQLDEAEQLQKQQSYQLAMLKQKADQLRDEIGNPVTALGIDNAIKEIKEINNTLNKMHTKFSEETQRQIDPVEQFYESKMVKLSDQRNQPKSMYETERDYKKRVSQFDRQISEIKREMNLKISNIRQKIGNELRQQEKPLLNQRAEITKQVFPVGIGNVYFKLGYYNAEKQQFIISFTIKEIKEPVHAFAVLPIPKKKAAQYGKHPELLVPDVTLLLNSSAKFRSVKFSFTGPERDEHVCKSIIFVKGTSLHQKGRFIVDYETVLDKHTGLMWASRVSRHGNWHDAKNFCENYHGGGYSDWRLPRISELEELHSADYKTFTALNDCCAWAAETSGSSSTCFPFNDYGAKYDGGYNDWYHHSQTFYKCYLPVRGGK